jgi:HEAT repeat protein
MPSIRRPGVAAGLSLAALALCGNPVTAGEAPAPSAPPAAIQRDIDAVNRLLRERQRQNAAPAPAPRSGVAAPAGAPLRRQAAPDAAPAAARPAPDAAAIGSAIERLAHESPAERTKAQKELRAAGAAAVPALIDALEDRKEAIRIGAVAVLGQIRDQRAAEPLARLLDTSSKPVWDALSGAFSAFGKKAAPALIEALGSNDDAIRSRAAELMGSIGDPRFGEPLIERLNRDRNSWVRIKIAGALGQIGDRGACEALLDTLDEL